MNDYQLLTLEVLASIAISLAVLRVLARPLADILDKLCPEPQSVMLWLSYTKLMLVIAPLLLVLTTGIFARFSDPLDSLRLALMAALGGLLLGLRVIAKRLDRFVDAPQSPPSPSPPSPTPVPAEELS